MHVFFLWFALYFHALSFVSTFADALSVGSALEVDALAVLQNSAHVT
jgi:hypothetical protein